MRHPFFSPEYQVLSAHLQEVRRSAGFTQTELAHRLGKPQSYVAKIERGERRVDVFDFIALAKALDREPGEFLRTLTSRLGAK